MFSFSQEPTIWLNVIQAVLVLLVAFGLALTGPQTAAIMALSQVVLVAILRAKVSPVDKPAEG